MSTLLYRVGRATYRHPFRVVAVWVVLLVALVGALALNPPKLSTEFRIDGTPAQEVIDELARELPEVSGGQGSLVFQASSGERLDSDRLAPVVAEAVQGVYGIDPVVDPAELTGAREPGGPPAAGSPGDVPQPPGAAAVAPGALVVDGRPIPGVMVSEDGRVALFQFQFEDQLFELPKGTVADTVAAAEAPAEEAGVAVLPGATLQEIPEIIGIGEIVGLAVAALVLVVTLTPRVISAEVVKGRVAEQITAWTGREVAFDADPKISFTPYLNFSFGRTVIGCSRFSGTCCPTR